MISRFEKYDKSTNISHIELSMVSSLRIQNKNGNYNIDIFEDLMKYRCLIESRKNLELHRSCIVKQIKQLFIDKEKSIKRIKDITENGKIHFTDLEESIKSELVNIKKNIKKIRGSITHAYHMINCIKHMERCIDSKMTVLTNIVLNPNLTKLAEYYKSKMEKENGKSE